ncbi:MAG TPA: hypothetical protein VJB16_07440, partial [archaeon]|nr:hypothetical protein [archaeon]
ETLFVYLRNLDLADTLREVRTALEIGNFAGARAALQDVYQRYFQIIVEREGAYKDYQRQLSTLRAAIEAVPQPDRETALDLNELSVRRAIAESLGARIAAGEPDEATIRGQLADTEARVEQLERALAVELTRIPPLRQRIELFLDEVEAHSRAMKTYLDRVLPQESDSNRLFDSLTGRSRGRRFLRPEDARGERDADAQSVLIDRMWWEVRQREEELRQAPDNRVLRKVLTNTFVRLAATLINAGRLRELRRRLRPRAIHALQDDARGLAAFAKVYAAYNLRGDAMRFLQEEVIPRHPEYLIAYDHLLTLLVATKRHQQAFSLIRQTIRQIEALLHSPDRELRAQARRQAPRTLNGFVSALL